MVRQGPAPQLRSPYIVERQGPLECGMLIRNTSFPRAATSKDLRQWCDRISAGMWAWAYKEYYRQLQRLEWQCLRLSLQR